MAARVVSTTRKRQTGVPQEMSLRPFTIGTDTDARSENADEALRVSGLFSFWPFLWVEVPFEAFEPMREFTILIGTMQRSDENWVIGWLSNIPAGTVPTQAASKPLPKQWKRKTRMTERKSSFLLIVLIG